MTLTKKRKDKGQLTIFMGISLMIIITMLAFVINVGLFVKAKINLQNAVDSSAWSGASVQARHLTNIAYMNWEMRNVFKRWMFKYYVIGQSSLDKKIGAGRVNFTLNPFVYDKATPQTGGSAVDTANVPTVCIDFTGNHVICNIFTIPGLPRFGSHGSPTIDAHYNASLNEIVKMKATDCSSRSALNFMSAVEWVYGTGTGGIFPGATAKIATDHPGAWLKAIELGIRVRNLESFVNQAPYPTVCRGGSGCKDITEVTDDGPYPYNERTIKAFWSGYRNLGGGTDLSFKRSYKLTELSITPLTTGGLGSYLIPEDSTYNNKYYLDLQAMPINYVTFFTAFTISGSELDNDPTVKVEASCQGTKIGVPVPGYLLGFMKNPEVLTYYAVKAEATFVGLFYPFKDSNGIKLEAYAAAKPFGGRIGPKLFDIDGSELHARNNDELNSAPYVTTLASNGEFALGKPIPSSSTFWASSGGDTIGGIPGQNGDPKFVVPNLIYDYVDLGNTSNPVNSAENTQGIGLYSEAQWIPFSGPLENTPTDGITGQLINDAIDAVQKPTLYEAVNYLIPTKNGDTAMFPAINSTASVVPHSNPDYYQLYGPLFGDGLLYGDITEVTGAVNNVINSLGGTIDTYIAELTKVAEKINELGATATTSDTGGNLYKDAADTIADGDQSGCDSLENKFDALFTGGGGCGIGSLAARYSKYWMDKFTDAPGFQNYYHTKYTSGDVPLQNLMTAYMPGTRQGATEDGVMYHPLGLSSSKPVVMKRNFYSTKFVSLERLTSTGVNQLDAAHILIDRGTYEGTQDISGDFHNRVEPTELNEFGKLYY